MDLKPDQLSTVIAIASAVFTGIGVLLLARQIRKDHDWNRRRASTDVLLSWVTGDVREIWKTLETDFHFKLFVQDQNYQKISDTLDDTRERQRLKSTVLSLLNYLEVTSVSMKYGVLDERIIYDFASLHFVLFWEWAQPLIREYTDRDPTIYIEYRKYVERWKPRTVSDLKLEMKRQKSEKGKSLSSPDPAPNNALNATSEKVPEPPSTAHMG